MVALGAEEPGAAIPEALEMSLKPHTNVEKTIIYTVLFRAYELAYSFESLVFRAMTLEQTASRYDSMDLLDNSWILCHAVTHPYLHYTEVLLGRDCNPIDS